MTPKEALQNILDVHIPHGVQMKTALSIAIGIAATALLVIATIHAPECPANARQQVHVGGLMLAGCK